MLTLQLGRGVGEPSAPRYRGPRQGAGTKVEATADIQTGQSLGREVGNSPNILVLPITPWGALWKSMTFSLKG